MDSRNLRAAQRILENEGVAKLTDVLNTLQIIIEQQQDNLYTFPLGSPKRREQWIHMSNTIAMARAAEEVLKNV